MDGDWPVEDPWPILSSFSFENIINKHLDSIRIY